MILWVAWLFFNGGSTLSLQTPRANSSPKIILNTLLAAAVAGLVTAWFKPIITRKYSQGQRFFVNDVCNGILVGCVGITGACDQVENWAAFIIGVFSALFYTAGAVFLEKLNIDDPVEATAVHAFGGIWGLISVGTFSNLSGIIYVNPNRGYFFGLQIAGIVCITCFTTAICVPYLLICKWCGVIRQPLSLELVGHDIAESGGLHKGLYRKMRLELYSDQLV